MKRIRDRNINGMVGMRRKDKKEEFEEIMIGSKGEYADEWQKKRDRTLMIGVKWITRLQTTDNRQQTRNNRQQTTEMTYFLVDFPARTSSSSKS